MTTTPDRPASTAVGGSEPADALDQMAGIAPDSAAARARAIRPEVVRAAQGSYLALLAPDHPGGLGLVERALIALRVARLTPSAPAAALYRARLARLGVDEAEVAAVERLPDGASVAPRLTAILRHTDRLTTAPRTATPAHLAELKAAGLAPAEIVTIAQLIALVTFQARVAATLRALGGGRMTAAQPRFTQETLRWRPWIETVDDVGATPEQAALVAEVAPSPDSRPYYAVLAHDPPALRERTALFNAIMYGPGGLRRADRELTTVAASRINGCVYCASVHARRYSQLTRDTAVIQRLLDEGVDTELAERERALVDFAAKLTREPDAVAAADLAPLRRLGLADAEILDAALATAMFAWANRLMQTLGEPEPSTAG